VVAVLVVGVAVAAYPAGTHLSGPATSGSGSQLENRTTAVPPYYSDLQVWFCRRRCRRSASREGRERHAYQVAAGIPEVLAQLPCYCLAIG
jgi:hypothetical protein